MRIVKTLALAVLAACQPAPAPETQGNLEQLVRACQEHAGVNFTYTDETAKLLRAKAFKLEVPEGRSPEDWMACLRTALAAEKLEIERIGPEHISVWLVRPIAKRG